MVRVRLLGIPVYRRLADRISQRKEVIAVRLGRTGRKCQPENLPPTGNRQPLCVRGAQVIAVRLCVRGKGTEYGRGIGIHIGERGNCCTLAR